MAFKRREEPTPIEEERDALRAQHAALEDLKRQLGERIDAIRDREVELHHALAAVGSDEPRAAATVARRPTGSDADAETGENTLEAARREKALLEREQVVTKREALLEARSHELAAKQATPGPPPDPDPARLAQIEARLAELRDAEKLFLRTRDELAARSEAVAARERLVSQRERELDEREDADGGDPATGAEFSEMEVRLRRLEQQQQDPREQTLGFSGGLKKLEQGSRQQRPG